MVIGHPDNFRVTTTRAVAIAAVALLTPFAVNNFVQGRPVLGIGSTGIVLLLAINAWLLAHGRYYPLVILLGLVPAVLAFLLLSLSRQGLIGALWCYPAVLAFYAMLPERHAWIANLAIGSGTTPLAWHVLDHPLAARFAATLVAVSTFTAIFVRVITVQQRRLEAQATTDALTGLLNRTLLPTTLERAVQVNGRTGTPMTLLAIDVDEFKAINDTLGHGAGDAVLRRLADFLRGRIRKVDHVFRVGGEEFLYLLYGTDAINGYRVADELRRSVRALALLPDREVTVSIGIATVAEGDGWSDWMNRADRYLYEAKETGRNRVVGEGAREPA